MSNFEDFDATGLAALVAAKEASPRELLDEVLSRIEKLNPTINAVSVDGAEFANTAIEQGLPDGPFKGVPFLLKDLGASCPGLPATDGSRFNPPTPSEHLDNVTRRFQSSGLVFAGRTNSPEYGLTTTTEPVRNGATRNPWNLAYSAGGSSGGASAAVAAGIVPAAHASDGGGSIRIPASSCGLFGLKPSRGRISAGPMYGDGWSGLSTNHVITRSVRDSAAFLDVLQGPEPGDPYAAPAPQRPYREEVGAPTAPLRIALALHPFSGAPAEEAVIDNAREAALLCEQLGHQVAEAQPQFDYPAFSECFVSVVSVHTAILVDYLEQVNGRRAGPDDLETGTLVLAERGRNTSGMEFQSAIDFVHRVSRRLGEFFDRYDMILSPVQAVETPKLGWVDLMQPPDLYRERIQQACGFTSLFNATGCPAMSVPLHWSAGSGVPQGTQFAAKYGAEDLLLKLASQLEEARPWAGKRPSL